MKKSRARKKLFIELSIIVIIAVVFSLFNVSINILDFLYNFFSIYVGSPAMNFLTDLVFLLLLGALWITYRRWKRAVKEQAELEEIFSSVRPDTFIVIDSDRTIIKCNDSVSNMFGYKVKDVVGKRISLFYPLQTHELSWWQVALTKIERDGHYIGTVSAKRKNGEEISLELIGDKLGSSGEIVLLLRDVTKRVFAREALRDSLQTLKDIVQAIPSGLFIYQFRMPDKFILLDCNTRAEQLTGVKLDDCRGKKFEDIWPDAHERRLTDALIRVLKSGEMIEANEYSFKLGHIEKVFDLRIFSMPRSRIGVAMEDITRRALAEEELVEVRDKLAREVMERNYQLEMKEAELSAAFDHFRKEKLDIINDFTTTIDEAIMPIIMKLKWTVSPESRNLVELLVGLIEDGLKDMSSKLLERNLVRD